MAGLDANNARYTYTRRADGKITALTHPNGVTTTRDYDEVGRLAKITHLDLTGKVLESEASTYDQRIVLRCAHDLPNGFADGDAAIAAKQCRLTRTRADGSTDLFDSATSSGGFGAAPQRFALSVSCLTSGTRLGYDPAGQVTAAAYGQDKVASALAEPQENQNNPVNPENPANPVQKSGEAEEKDFTANQTFVYDEAGSCPSLRSRPAKWLRVW